MRILVTGAAGFIGSHLVHELEQSHEVIPVDIKLEPLQHDIRRPEMLDDLIGLNQPDRIVHLAARVGRLFGEDDVAETISDNAAMTAIVAKACGEWGIPLVYASTSEIYGDLGNTLAYEAITPGRVHNVYGLSKRWGEEACHLYAPDELLIWRISMPFGPGLPAGRGRAAIVNMLYQADNRLPIPVHRGAERSWCWVGDSVRAMRLSLDYPGTYNIGRDDAAASMRRVAEIACELTDAPLDLIEEIDAPSNQTVVKRLATEKIRMLGWEPEVDLYEGMAQTLEWIRSQDWVIA